MAERINSSDIGALAVLAILTEAPNHPYGVAQQLRIRYRTEAESHTQRSIYRAIERLAKEGLIEVEETQREGHRPERTVYRCTEEGRSHLLYQLADFLSDPGRGPAAFEAAVARMGYLSEREAATALRVRLAALNGLVAQLGAVQSSLRDQVHLPRIVQLEVEWRLRLLEAEQGFTADTLAALEAGELDVGEEWLTWLARVGAQLPDLTGMNRDEVPLVMRPRAIHGEDSDEQ
jgi:DNA-binding PadR family transcriptional regulator